MISWVRTTIVVTCTRPFAPLYAGRRGAGGAAVPGLSAGPLGELKAGKEQGEENAFREIHNGGCGALPLL